MNRLILATAALLLLLAGPISAGEEYAFLYTSPAPRRGIPQLGPNAIESYVATYRVADIKFRVTYTEENVPILKEWKADFCGKLKLYVIPSEGNETRLYRDEKGYVVIFDLPEKWEYSCTFITNFVKDFNFFLNFRKVKSDIPFPAVVTLSKK